MDPPTQNLYEPIMSPIRSIQTCMPIRQTSTIYISSRLYTTERNISKSDLVQSVNILVWIYSAPYIQCTSLLQACVHTHRTHPPYHIPGRYALGTPAIIHTTVCTYQCLGMDFATYTNFMKNEHDEWPTATINMLDKSKRHQWFLIQWQRCRYGNRPRANSTV